MFEIPVLTNVAIDSGDGLHLKLRGMESKDERERIMTPDRNR